MAYRIIPLSCESFSDYAAVAVLAMAADSRSRPATMRRPRNSPRDAVHPRAWIGRPAQTAKTMGQ